MTVRWGILSTARINDKFLAGVAHSDAGLVSAVASRDIDRARSYASEHGIERAYGGYDDLLTDPEIEAVYISLPNSLHLEWTERALRADKHVLCEKPLSTDPDAVNAAFDLADQRGLVLMEAFMYRHNPQTLRVQELVRDGAVGRLRLIRASFSFVASDPSNIRLATGLDGGGLMDVGSYCVNSARMLAGEPLSVTAQQILGGDGVDVVFTGTMSFAEGVLADFDCGLALAARDELEVVGDRGSLFLDDPWHCLSAVIELRRDGDVERIELPRVDSYMLEAESMAAAIRGVAEPLLGRADAVGQATTLQALYDAARAASG
jgi:D-xylose 1-dehydrogenase (NADP+, D-xylono-1,5-lactone-forming)